MSEKQGSHIEVDRLLASFDNNDDIMYALLDKMGLLAYVEAIEDEVERAKLRAEIIDKLKSALEEINRQPINQRQAKTQFQIGKKHFNLHTLVFSCVLDGTAAISSLTEVRRR